MFGGAVGDGLVGDRLRRLLALLFFLGDLDRGGHRRGAARRARPGGGRHGRGNERQDRRHRQRPGHERRDRGRWRGVAAAERRPPAAAGPAAAPWSGGGAVVGAGAGFGLTGTGTGVAADAPPDGTVPHGRRTLPACTVTGSVKLSPPALIVTSVVPGLKAQNRPDSASGIGSSLGPPRSTALASGEAVFGSTKLPICGLRGGEGEFGRDPVRTQAAHAVLGNRDVEHRFVLVEVLLGAPSGARPADETGEVRHLAAVQERPRLGFERDFPDVRDQPGFHGRDVLFVASRRVDVDQQEPAGAEEVLAVARSRPRSSRASRNRRRGSSCCRAASRCSVRARRRSRPTHGRR